jgi:predicted glycoside hydrolase/deacetylase ChbG (UPF0249 family)
MGKICYSQGKVLLFQADDLGYDSDTNQRIVSSFKQGPIGGASLMVNRGEASEEGAEKAKEEGIPVGLHFNVTEGSPLSEVPSLVDGSNRFFPPARFLFRLRQGLIKPQDLKRECRAQIEKFLSWGFEPWRFDSHNHAHVMPGAFPVISPIIKEYGFRYVRCPREEKENFFRALPQMGRAMEILFLSLWADALSTYLKEQGFKTSENFAGILEQEPNFSLNNLRKMLKRLKPGFTEIMVHPGHRGEMEVLISDELQGAIGDKGFQILKPGILGAL